MFLFLASILLRTSHDTNRTVYFDIEYTPLGEKSSKIGRLIIDLHDDQVKNTTDNFYSLATNIDKVKKYQGSIFHRIIPNFMIQGGDFDNKNGTGGKSFIGNKFKDENFNIKHDKIGVVSMANSGPNTNGSQFFITVRKTEWLNNKHVAFGQVRSNCLDTLLEISNVKTYPSKDVPVSDVTIRGCGDFNMLTEKEKTNIPKVYEEIKEKFVERNEVL